MTDSAWGGRFREGTARLAERFSSSVHYDKRLAPQDLEGSLAHARMLHTVGILNDDDLKRIERGLREIREMIDKDKFDWNPAQEDVHMNIEHKLRDLVGDAGARLHTARSRNDQVSTDMRLWARSAVNDVIQSIDRLLAVVVHLAEQHLDVLMPGYTHMQRAQPVRLSHHLLAWAEMFERDRGRLGDALVRMDRCPLGAGALAGTTFAIDREHTSQALGFQAPTDNSLDTVSDRDFVVEICSALSLTAVHLSRVSEELVMWSSQEFGFVRIGDAYTTGSSMMPQKKNPDMSELVRGKTGRVIGNLVSILVTLKGLPLAYNRDMQEDKEPLFDALDTVRDGLDVTAASLLSATFSKERMYEALKDGFVNATEVADYLVNRGVPFREAHRVVGELVAKCVDEHRTLEGLTVQEYATHHGAFAEDVFDVLDFETCVEQRDVRGGPARSQVRLQLERWQELLRAREVNLES